MHQLRNEPVPEERVDVLRVRPQGAVFTCQEKIFLPGHTDVSLSEDRGESLPPDPNFTAILQHFYRTFMTLCRAPIYTLRGRTGTEAAPATEQGFPGAGVEDGFATAVEQ